MTGHRVEARVPGDHPCLAGHFPGNPVVPAVVMLECVEHALCSVLGRRIRVTALPNAKFLSPLAPDVDFAIELSLEPSGRGARFRCVTGDRELALGRIEFGDV